jgi:hypothetical protein
MLVRPDLPNQQMTPGQRPVLDAWAVGVKRGRHSDGVLLLYVDLILSHVPWSWYVLLELMIPPLTSWVVER